MKMSKAATKEYVVRMRERYGRMVRKRAKGRVLDEFCATTGLERKHAIKVLRSRREPLRATGRKAIYHVVGDALRKLWMTFDQPCSKLLHPVMASHMASYEKHAGTLEASARVLLLRMSPSTMDRLLRGHRVRTSLWRGRGGPMAALKREVPVRSERWEGRGPGWFEADTVGHGGGSTEGSYAYTLTVTDTDTQWTELRAVWNRGGQATMQRLAQIEETLPFAVKGVNTDNGPEFLNGHLIRHFKGRAVAVPQTRSRPYCKNDNPRVEQKNGSHVRALLGYERFGDPECVEPLNEILVLHSCWTNLFRPCMKLVSKVREGHRYKKRYDRPMTPAQRVLAWPTASEQTRARVATMLASFDCLDLKRNIEAKLRRFTLRFGRPGPNTVSQPAAGPGPSALRAAPAGTGPGPAAGWRPAGRHRRLPKGHARSAGTAPQSRTPMVSSL
jgi:hypothetical protein